MIGELFGIDRTAFLCWRSGHLLTPQDKPQLSEPFFKILSLSGDYIICVWGQTDVAPSGLQHVHTPHKNDRIVLFEVWYVF